jgi:hypothetical protein
VFEVIDPDTILIILESGSVVLDISSNDSLVLDAPTAGSVSLSLRIDNDGGPTNPFSFFYIPLLQTVEIPANQQMVVVDRIDIDGTLIIEGELCLI